VNRAEAEYILAPIILGFEVAKDRVAELIKRSEEQGLERSRLNEMMRHELELSYALRFIEARAKGWAVDGLMVAVDTGRSVATWPSVMPGSDYRQRIIAAWREGKAGTEAAPNVAPLARLA